MIFGILSSLFLILAFGKIIFGKAHGKIIRTLHMAFGGGVLITGAIHLTITLPLFQSRPLSIWITGFALLFFLSLTALSGMVNRKKWFKWHRRLAILSVIILITHVGANVVALSEYRKAAETITIPNLDISQIPDGTYEGECNIEFIYAKVRVTVHSGEIKNIEILEHRNERGKSAERLVEDMVIQQKIDVDTVSGATNSSKVIKMAVYNAFDYHQMER